MVFISLSELSSNLYNHRGVWGEGDESDKQLNSIFSSRMSNLAMLFWYVSDGVTNVTSPQFVHQALEYIIFDSHLRVFLSR